MSVEHQPLGPEQSAEQQHEIEQLGRERMEALTNSPERPDQDPDRRAEAAREAIERHQEEAPAPTEQAPTAAPVARHPIIDHALNYRQTLASIQRHLGPSSKRFSAVIHTPLVERSSETLERTVMRPSIVLGATWMAVIAGAIFYFTARHYGYPLSGSEMTLALVGGGILGFILEALLRLLRRR